MHLGPARAARSVRRPVRGRDPRGRAGVDHERLQRDRRRARAAARTRILDELLRGELGFDGVVVADYFAVDAAARATIASPPTRPTAARGARGRARRRAAGARLLRRAAARRGGARRGRRRAGRPARCAACCDSSSRSGCSSSPTSTPAAAPRVFDTAAQRALARERRPASRSCLLTNDGGCCRSTRRCGASPSSAPAPTTSALLQGDYHYPAHLEIIYRRDRRASRAERDGHPARGRRRFRPGAHFRAAW